jgi:hypothetical protein
LTESLNVLDAACAEYELETQPAVEQATVAIQHIGLCKTLGGGWKLYQDVPPPPLALPAIVTTFPAAVGLRCG